MKTEQKPSAEPFLRLVADDLVRHYGFNLSSLVVVFPNKRARLFFSRYLGEISGEKPVWAPSYRSISELIQELSGLVLADKLRLIFDLFSVYKNLSGTLETFDDFYNYCEILLADFEEVDKNLVNAKDLFMNLADQKSIEGYFDYLTENQLQAIRQFWNTFEDNKESKGQKDFLKFWYLLPEVYHAFRSGLKDKGLAYEGMIYREVADKIKNSGDLSLSFEKYVFAGFNALNKCEEMLFIHLKKLNKAMFYWDYDPYYIENKWHEAGFFIRENLSRFPSALNKDAVATLNADTKNITILPVSSFTAQAKVVPALLEKIGLAPDGETGQTALVLPDERLLIQVMYSLPFHIDNVNITMGYPLRESAMYGFLERIYILYKNSAVNSSQELTFFHKDLISVLNHAFVYPYYKETADRIIDEIRSQNRIHVSMNELRKQEELQFLFYKQESGIETLSYLKSALEVVIRNLLAGNDRENNPLQTEFALQVLDQLNRISEIVVASDLEFTSGLIYRILIKVMQGMTLPFTGEPLSGLQILGILETRSLDFENVIVLSMNEGIMPRPSQMPSFIPNNLRFGFGLTIPEHYDAIYAYYFYRLIQRATNVYLIYNESTDGMFTGEPSRFIQQLKYEKGYRIHELRLESLLSNKPPKPIVFQKTEQVLALLNRYLDHGGAPWLSPSALNEWINCPLKFYLHRIASLQEPDEVSDSVEPRLFGIILHQAMHEIYKPFTGQEVTAEIIASIIQQEAPLKEIIRRALISALFGDKPEKDKELKGMHLIIQEIIAQYVLQILRFDKENSPFRILWLEEKFQVSLPVLIQEKTQGVRLGGVVDRIDRYKGTVRIIDYKTGTNKVNFPDLNSLFVNKPSLRNDAAFQVFLYAFLCHTKLQGEHVVPWLYIIRECTDPEFKGLLNDQSAPKGTMDYKDYHASFSALLSGMLESLFDPSMPFAQTTDVDYCTHCPYKILCHRQ